MKVQFTKQAFDVYQKELEKGNQFCLTLAKGGCCGFSVSFENMYSKNNKEMVEFSLPTNDLDGNIKYADSGNFVPVSKEVSTLLNSALIDYPTKGLRKSFKVYPNQIK